MEPWEWKVGYGISSNEWWNGWNGRNEFRSQMNLVVAASMGLAGSPEGAKLGDIMGGTPEGLEGGIKGGMNLGQVRCNGNRN